MDFIIPQYQNLDLDLFTCRTQLPEQNVCEYCQFFLFFFNYLIISIIVKPKTENNNINKINIYQYSGTSIIRSRIMVGRGSHR